MRRGTWILVFCSALYVASLWQMWEIHFLPWDYTFPFFIWGPARALANDIWTLVNVVSVVVAVWVSGRKDK